MPNTKENKFTVIKSLYSKPSIDECVLKRGDIIILTTDSLSSKIIRFLTNSPFTHVLLYIGNGKVIEATPETGDIVDNIPYVVIKTLNISAINNKTEKGVKIKSINEAIQENDMAIAFRHPNMTSGKASQLASWAKRQVGKKYNYLGIAHLFVEGVFDLICGIINQNSKGRDDSGNNGRIPVAQEDTKFFCSELVSKGFQKIGLPWLARASDDTLPQDITNYALRSLECIGYLNANRSSLLSFTQ